MDYFDYDEVSDLDVEEFLEQSQEREEQRLEEELERIEEELEHRSRIHDEVVGEIESKLEWYIDRLDMLYKRGLGKTGEREEVKARVREFYREIREEKQRYWEDIQQLKREKRELIMELEEIDDLDFLSEFL